jgi:preprotein translocase subunit SecY
MIVVNNVIVELMFSFQELSHCLWGGMVIYTYIICKYLLQANLPKEISDYLNKMSARVPRIKPGRATVDYLTKIQTSTRFWGTQSSSYCQTL